MSAPMTSERCARLLADTKRILDLVEGPWTVPDRRDMEALSRIVQDVPALLDEVERLRAELAEARRGKVDQMLGRLDDWSGDLATVVADRDRLAGQVKALADEWDETITSGVMRGQEWEQCLRANLPRLRAALGGTEAGR